MYPLKADTGKKWSLLESAIFSAFSLLWETVALLVWRAGKMPFWFPLFGAPFVLIGLLLLGFSLAPLMARAKVAAPQALISQHPLRVGEKFTFTFRLRLKQPTEVQRVRLQWVFRETAIYQRGTETYTETYERLVEGEEYPASSVRLGDTLHLERSFQVPVDGMHTFIAPHNKLQWFLKVQAEISRWPDFKEEYEVTVLPEMVG